MTTKSDFCICRVFGNDLPPRDTADNKLKSLKDIVEKDKENEIDKIWILNRILNKNYLKSAREILADQIVYEMPFCRKEYKRARTFNEKVQYLTNINPARNFSISKAWEKHLYAISLDGDCFFENNNEFKNIIREIELNSHMIFFGLNTSRIINSSTKTSNEELFLIVKKNEQKLFNENIIFGDGDKTELLKRIGFFRKEDNSWASKNNECKIIGSVCHIGYDELYERNLSERLNARKIGLKHLVEKADSLFLI